MQEGNETLFGRIKQKLREERLRKISLFSSVMIYGVPILIVIFILIYSSGHIGTHTYTLDVGSIFDTSSLKALHLDESKTLGTRVNAEGDSYREILSNKAFNLSFNSPVRIDFDKETKLKLNLEGENTALYVNNQLVLPDLSNYTLLRDFEEESVYVRKDIKIGDLSEVGNAESLISSNFPGSSVYSTGDRIVERFEVPGYEAKETVIDTSFRDNLNLAVYGENLSVSFEKEDMNWYNGTDEYYVAVKDKDGRVIINEIFKDDGNFWDDRIPGKQIFSFDIDFPLGLYFISFEKVDLKNADVILRDISVNSNKIDILGNFLPWDKASLYTETSLPETVGFYYWWATMNQTVSITGTRNYLISLDEDYLAQRYDLEMKEGRYNVYSPKGHMWIYSSLAWSVDNDHYFTIPIINKETVKDADFIILDKKDVKIDGNNIEVSVIIENSEVQKITLRAGRGNALNLTSAEVTIR